MASDQTPGNGSANDGDMSFRQAWEASQAKKAITPDAHQTLVVSQALQRADIVRRDLAALYADSEGGTILEHEVGECLTKVRAACKRLREALGNVAQMRLGDAPSAAPGGANRERH